MEVGELRGVFFSSLPSLIIFLFFPFSTIVLAGTFHFFFPFSSLFSFED